MTNEQPTPEDDNRFRHVAGEPTPIRVIRGVVHFGREYGKPAFDWFMARRPIRVARRLARRVRRRQRKAERRADD